MGFLRRCLLSLALLGTVLAPRAAAASDFSQFGEPGFARLAFLPPGRAVEVMCIGYARYTSQHGGEVTAAEAETLSDAVTARLEAETGSRKWADRFVAVLNSWDDPEFDPAAFYADMGPTCAPLITAVRDGTLAAKLTPLGGSPIQLPDGDTCLAYDLLAKDLDPPITDNFLNDPNGVTPREILLGEPGPEREARQKRVAEIAARLGPVPRRQLEMILSIGCIPTIIAAMPNWTEESGFDTDDNQDAAAPDPIADEE